MSRIRLVTVDDWAGIFVDGILRDEGHNIDLWTLCKVLKELGVDIEEENLDLSPDDMARIGYRMPDTYEELPHSGA